MGEDVTSVELRSAVHDVILDKEQRIAAIRGQHESTVSELYRLLSRKRNHGSAFPAIDLEDVEKEPSFEEFEEWKRQLELGVGSSKTNNIDLPSIPPPSPPVGVTIFPDEVPDPPMKEEAAPSPAALVPPIVTRRPSRKSPAAPAAPAFSPTVPMTEPIAGPSRLPTPPITSYVSLSDVQPRSRRVFSPSLPPTVTDWIPVDNYNPATEAPSTPPHILMPLESEYSSNLPHLPTIPRRRKRKGSKGDDGPNDPYKLQAIYSTNPISNSLATSSKCVLTSDWKIALAELRHLRTMERIEQKMENGRWSLRQPKKMKGPPIRKAHWDHLLEEMEWMRLDFAEERRWKRVLAREFAYQVVEWHLSSPRDKASLMVGGIGWGARRRASASEPKPKTNGQAAPEIKDKESAEDDVAMDEEADEENTGGQVLDEIMPRRATRGRNPKRRADAEEDLTPEPESTKDDDVEMDIGEAEPSAEPAAKSTEEVPALQPAAAEDTDKPTSAKSVPKPDADADAEGEADPDGEADAEGEVDAQGEDDGESADVVDGVIGLGDIPDADGADAEGEIDPDADGEGEVEVVAENAQQVATVEPPRGIKLSSGIILSDRFKGPEQLTLVRAPVLDSAITTGIVDIPAMEEQLAARNGEYTGDGPLSLEEVFPDMTAYAGPMPIEEGHAPKYRMEEGQMPYHRPAHTSRIMDLEPIFVSTLQPATNERDGSWDLQDGPWYDDYKGSTEIPYEVLAASTSIFQGRTARVTGYHQSAIPEPSAHKLRAPLVWTPEDDAALQKLVAMYPFNWHLIADSFNSEVVTIPTERRLPYDCYERWDLNFGPDAEKKRKIAAAAEAAKAAAAATAAAASAASTNAQAQAQAVPGTASTAGGTEPNGGPPSLSINTAVPRPNGQPSAVAVPTLPGQNAEAGPSDAPPPPGLSKREAKAAARNRYEGSKKAIRHQAMFDAVRRLSRRRDATKSKTSNVAKQVITIHESHCAYLNLPVQDPITLSQLKHEHEVRRAIAQQQHQEQQAQQAQHGGREQYMREMQRQRMMAAAMGNGNGPQQQPIRPGPPGPGMPQGQGQQPRLGPNGQPLPPIAASQQQILNAVAAATAANRQVQGQGQNTPGGSVRPLPQQNQGGPMQGQQRVPVQQMQQVEAQMIAAQMVQARAQQAQNQRAASAGGTPQSQPGNLAATPYQGMSDLNELNGEGIPQHLQSSPAIINAQLGMHSSPQGRPGQMPMAQAPHLRGPSGGSPQMGNMPNQGPQLNQAAMAQIVAQIQASGGQPTPEAVRAQWARYMHGIAQQQQQHQAQAQAQAQAQGQGQVQVQQQGTPQQGTPQGLPQFSRSPSMGQNQMRQPSQ